MVSQQFWSRLLYDKTIAVHVQGGAAGRGKGLVACFL